MRCAYCGRPAEGQAAIHRDGFCEGPQVWLCNAHGKKELPSCEQIWARIKERMPLDTRCYCEHSSEEVLDRLRRFVGDWHPGMVADSLEFLETRTDEQEEARDAVVQLLRDLNEIIERKDTDATEER